MKTESKIIPTQTAPFEIVRGQAYQGTDGVVVLATGEAARQGFPGTVIHAGSPHYVVGEFSFGWITCRFSPFTGEISLKFS